MSGFEWSPGGCCCFGYLDCYRDVDGADLYRAQSVYPDGPINLSASLALWSIDRDSSGYTLEESGVVAAENDLVLEVLYDSPTLRIQVYDVAAQTIELTDDENGSNLSKISFSDTGAGAIKYTNSGKYYRFWNAAYTVTERGPFTDSGTRATTAFSMGLDSYSDSGVLDGTTAVPLCVARWDYPRCLGFKITDVTFGTWEYKSGFPAPWGATFECEYDLVEGDVDWSVDDPPVIDDDTTWSSHSFDGTCYGDDGETDATNEAAAQALLAKLIRGELIIDFDIDDGRVPGFISAGAASPSKTNQASDNAPIALYESHRGSIGAAVVKWWDYVSGSKTDVIEFIIDGTVKLTSESGTEIDQIYDLITIPSADYSFATIARGSDSDRTLYVYDDTGALDWSENGDIFGGHVFGASDRHIYVQEVTVDRDAKIGANLPEFTDGTHDPNNGADTWGDWLVSHDGTRWNPARALVSGDFEEPFQDPAADDEYIRGDVIKDSTSIPLCPPDDWF